MALNLPRKKCDHHFGQERVASDIQQHSVQVRVIIGCSESLLWRSLMLHDTVMAKRPNPSARGVIIVQQLGRDSKPAPE